MKPTPTADNADTDDIGDNATATTTTTNTNTTNTTNSTDSTYPRTNINIISHPSHNFTQRPILKDLVGLVEC